MAVKWELHYDRRVSEQFLAHFLPGGLAESLVQYARHAPYPVDLQMRHDPKSKAEHASLYVGLTSVLDVVRAKDKLRLRAHKTWAEGAFGFSSDWTTNRAPEKLGERWQQVEDYLEAVIPAAASTHATQEGAVQAAASMFTGPQRIMVDREVVVSFRDDVMRKQAFKEVAAPLVSAVGSITGIPGKAPDRFGGECDLLALDSHGRLLAVEVKPRNTGSIVWSGVQAVVYARLLERWLKSWKAEWHVDRPSQVLRGMLEQRHRMGLAPYDRPEIADVPAVIPVVAIQRGANPIYVKRMKLVQRALLEGGHFTSPPEVYEVNMAGRLDPLDV